MTKEMKSVLYLVIAVLLFIFIVNALASGLNMGHECTGEDCLVCLAISLRKRSVQPMLLLCIISVLSLSAIAKLVVASPRLAVFVPITLVCLKVKLSN